MATIKAEECPHLAEASAQPKTNQCSVCGLSHPIRVCLTCGNVGCCESTGAHALAHSKETGHAVIRELPISDRSFTWCYSCNSYVSG